ncbi:MAG: glycosyltransferase family 2 protein [Limnochordaceae bacterium]|nr:glycosyltransferase family 2 protein [Limnochordaceae bacterium]
MDERVRCLAAVLHWNAPEQAARCVRSVLAAGVGKGQVVVVDNASTLGSVEDLITKLAPLGVTVRRNGDNIGYAGGMNVAVGLAQHVGARFALLLTQDVVLDPGAIEELLGTAESFERVGVVAPVVYWLQKPTNVFSAGGWVDPRRARVGHFLTVEGHAPYEVAWVDGCCMLVRVDMIEEIGAFDEGYFMYWEENDLCQRARRAGWRVMVAPGAVAWHEGGVDRPRAYWHFMVRNAYTYWKRHFAKGFTPVMLSLVGWVVRRWALALLPVDLGREGVRVGRGVRIVNAVRATWGLVTGTLAYWMGF